MYVLKHFLPKRSLNSMMVSVYQGVDFSIEEVKAHLNGFPGGRVDISFSDESGIATMCLNHPEKKNAISGKMMVDLDSAVTQLESRKNTKGLLIMGVENNFCSGGDLDFAEKTGTPEGGYKMAKFMQNVLIRLQKLPIISVAFIEGFALGGGAELAIHCDFRVFADQKSAMGFVHGKMGIMPAWGGLTAAVQTLGYRTALDLVTTSRVVRTVEAQSLGLCDAVVGDVAGATAWLAQRTHADVNVVHAVKSAAHYSRFHMDTCQARLYEMSVFSPLWGAPANKLALSQKLKHKT